ncbi:MAG: DUF2336 domain-containing protein [Rhodobacteraceae bacterium]|nr:DUF2336 domain-containing protein [Paracoccaceae bacterium]
MKVANALCAAFDKVAPGSEDYEKIEKVVRVLIASAVEQVRVAAAKALRHRATLPRDMALTIAKDTDLVASPFLEVTAALSDEDLIEVVRASSSMAKMMSISRRNSISEGLSDILIENGNEQVVASVVGNAGAVISLNGYDTALDRFPKADSIQAAMIDRSAVPGKVMARLLTVVSSALRQRLVKRHGMPSEAAHAIATEARERAGVGLGFGLDEAGLEALVSSLMDQGFLTASFLARALCAGNVQLFEHGLAKVAQRPITEIRKAAKETSSAAFSKIWHDVGFEDDYVPLLFTAYEVIRQTDLEADKWNTETYRKLILQRMLTLDKSIDNVLSIEEIQSLIDAEEELRAAPKSDAA